MALTFTVLTATSADRPAVREQLHRLDRDGVLVDRYDDEDVHLVCLDGDLLVGVLTVGDARPSSVDGEPAGVDRHLPTPRSQREVLLLAVAASHRSEAVLSGMCRLLVEHCAGRLRGTVIAASSVRQLPLYRRLGFVPSGPEVGEDGARCQPVRFTAEAVAPQPSAIPAARVHLPRQRSAEPLSLLPGPVPLAPQVSAALGRPPRAHRWPDALARLERVRELLRVRTGARHVAVLTGSGTTANDVVAAQLALRPGPGLVLAAGEFGERLVDAARRARLDVRVLRAPEGSAVDGEQVAAALAGRPAGWVWSVHCETSTGVLFDLPGLLDVCRSAGAELALDAISSLGCAPVDLTGVLLATASSGKALAGFPGLAVVLARDEPAPGGDVPRCLDLRAYTTGDGVPSTLPTALVGGLLAALEARPAEGEQAALAGLGSTGAWLRRELVAHGLEPVAQERWAAPAVVSVRLPPGTDVVAVADAVATDGFLLAAHSGYLRERGWVQISLMGRPSTDELRRLPALLAERAAVAVRR